MSLKIDTSISRQAIVTKYFGPTNSRGSRIKATADAGTLTVPYDPALSVSANHAASAKALADRFEWTGRFVMGGLPNGDYVFVFAGEVEE